MQPKIVEVRQNIIDSSISRDIFDCSKIIQQLVALLEYVDTLNYYDFEYISILSDKAKLILYKMFVIMQTYMEVENGELSRYIKKKID